jgi:hypothetical protein
LAIPLLPITVSLNRILSPDVIRRVSRDTLTSPFLRRLDTQRGLLLPDILSTTEPALLSAFLLLGTGLPLAPQNTTDSLGRDLELLRKGSGCVDLGKLGVEGTNSGQSIRRKPLSGTPAFGELLLQSCFLILPKILFDLRYSWRRALGPFVENSFETSFIARLQGLFSSPSCYVICARLRFPWYRSVWGFG